MKPSENSIRVNEVLTLADQLRAGDTAVESTFIAKLEAVADELALDNPAQFVTLMEAVHDVPLQTAVARQKVLYYYATALRRDGRVQASVQVFADLLAEPELSLPIYGRALNSQAIGYRLLGESEKAISNYQESLALWQELGDAENQGKVHLNMGIMAYELRRYDEAERHLQQAVEFLEALNLVKLIAIAHNELGLVNRDRGHWEAALAYFNSFVAQRRADGASDNVAAGLTNIGEIKLYQGKVAEAEQYFLDALNLMQAPEYRLDMLLHLGLVYQVRGDLQRAQAIFDQALELAEAIERREFLPYVYYHIGDVQRLLGNGEGAVAAWETAVSLVESSRDLIQDAGIRISLLGRWQQIYEALLLHALARDRVTEAFAWAERTRARAFAEGLAARSVDVAALADVQAALPADTVMLCYFTTGVLAWDLPMLQTIAKDNPLRDHVLLPPRILLFVISNQKTAVHLCPLDPNKFATASPRGQDITRYLQPAVSARLFDSLLAAAAVSLRSEQLIVIPHGPLHHVPFTAVLDHLQPNRPVMRLAPSGTVWWQQQKQEKKTGTGPILAVAYPGKDLLFAEKEATAVASLMQGETLLGAVDKHVLAETAVDRRLLHFACHAQFSDDDPLNSYLELGPDTKLTARDVLADWQLTAELVVLSACQTGLSHILRGDEPMGLIRAFLSAGAHAVLVTQWPVEDLPAFLLMTRFYRLLAADETLPLSKALHQAQQWLRQVPLSKIERILVNWQMEDIYDWKQEKRGNEALFSEPRHWAGFILVGG